MPESHRIKVKFGTAEFEAEGEPEAVQAQYSQFLEILAKAPAAAANAASAPVEKRTSGTDEIDSDTAAKIFGAAADGTVSLLILPKGENKEIDAFLLLLYAYRRQGHDRVLGTQILRSGAQSGISVRAANVYPTVDRFVLRGGQRKGTTYQLNNQGVIQAQEIARKLLD